MNEPVLRFENAKSLVFFAVHGFRPAALWRQPSDADVFQTFVARCQQDKGIEGHALLVLHDDDLRTLFDELAVPVAERVIVRYYLAFPHLALANAWTAAKVALAVTASVWRFFWRFGRTLVIISAAAVVGAAFFQHRRVDAILFERVRRAGDDFVNVERARPRESDAPRR